MTAREIQISRTYRKIEFFTEYINLIENHGERQFKKVENEITIFFSFHTIHTISCTINRDGKSYLFLITYHDNGGLSIVDHNKEIHSWVVCSGPSPISTLLSKYFMVGTADIIPWYVTGRPVYEAALVSRHVQRLKQVIEKNENDIAALQTHVPVGRVPTHEEDSNSDDESSDDDDDVDEVVEEVTIDNDDLINIDETDALFDTIYNSDEEVGRGDD